ncbi:MAG: TrbI/VirB10 family protein, partial [Pseudomonadota bacterium]
MPGNAGEEGDNPPRNSAAGFRLRPERPRVMRLSRKVLAGLAGVASLAIMGALIWALDSNRRGQQTAQELFNTSNKTTADGLAALPKDYTGVPQL